MDVKSWREEDCHFVLTEEVGVTVYGAIVPPTTVDTPLHWHYHEHDSIIVTLSSFQAMNETIEKPRSNVSLEKGDVLVYNLRNEPRYMHRFWCSADCKSKIAFIGAEVCATPWPRTIQRATLKNATPLQPSGLFASASRIEVPPKGELKLVREAGRSPLRSIVVPLNQTGLDSVNVKGAAKCQIVRKMRYGFSMEAFLVSEKSAGIEVQNDDACVVINTNDNSWVGIVMDIWANAMEISGNEK